MEIIPKEGGNDKVFKNTARIEQLKIKNINTLNNKRNKKWYKISGINDLQISEVEKKKAIFRVAVG